MDAHCPVDGSADRYDLVVETERVVPVEHIFEAIDTATREPIFQEDLTRALADLLGCRVVTVGTHSGVKTTCEAGP